MKKKLRQFYLIIRLLTLTVHLVINRIRMRWFLRKGRPYTSPKLVKLDIMTCALGYRAQTAFLEWEKLREQNAPTVYKLPEGVEENPNSEQERSA